MTGNPPEEGWQWARWRSPACLGGTTVRCGAAHPLYERHWQHHPGMAWHVERRALQQHQQHQRRRRRPGQLAVVDGTSGVGAAGGRRGHGGVVRGGCSTRPPAFSGRVLGTVRASPEATLTEDGRGGGPGQAGMGMGWAGLAGSVCYGTTTTKTTTTLGRQRCGAAYVR